MNLRISGFEGGNLDEGQGVDAFVIRYGFDSELSYSA